MRFSVVLLLALVSTAGAAPDENPPKAAALTKENTEFFETRIRPVLAEAVTNAIRPKPASLRVSCCSIRKPASSRAAMAVR